MANTKRHFLSDLCGREDLNGETKHGFDFLSDLCGREALC
ncbi:hypothetical protein AO385_0022 [Moraxella catarrhalis]|uniref:Uncharacterized protein n=1 Tax=Moraxella catarrhalis TaxID=480 RepID=A0A198UJP3_MORCA|nr:hypothetical protein AO384_0854 [Moraxella catarrhalis]OAV04702.1 hypothetical protein AO385_0022 [Moraxella catarrhalis]